MIQWPCDVIVLLVSPLLGYENQDWFIPSPALPVSDKDLALTPDQIRETLNYFLLCSNRVSQMTKTYNDIEAVTRLLEEKEKDLELTARIGKELLTANGRLEARVTALEGELRSARDHITQLRHDLNAKTDLLQVLTNDTEECSSPEEQEAANAALLRKRTGALERENRALREEAARLAAGADTAELAERQLLRDIANQLASANSEASVLGSELVEERQRSVDLQQQLDNINARLIVSERNYQQLNAEHEHTLRILEITKENQNALAAELADTKLDVNEDDSETVSLRLLEMLGSVKYRPPGGVEPTRFRAQLLAGDARTIHHVLHWLLTNRDQVKNTAYLAKYLKLPDIPPDVARNNTVQDLLDLYQNLIDEFKEVHKRTRLLQKENAAEIINDIKEMALERDIVIKRLENVQVNLVDVNDKEELLNISRALRVQQEKAKELENQYDAQQSQLKMASDQLKRYLNVIHGQSATPKTVNDVMKRLQEEVQLNNYLVKEKLPLETANLQKELNIMQKIAAEQHPTRSDLVAVQDKIAAVNSEMEHLVQRKLATAGPQEDKLAPFRQQAAVIRRNKEASATRVHELAATLKDHEATLADLQSQVRQLLGDTVLRGEELKKYVNSLRTKSTVYKRQRANLSTFKVEAGILARTLHIINAADPTVEMALLNHKKLKIEDEDTMEKSLDKSTDLTKKSLHDLSQLVAQTAQKLSQVRQEIQPLADNIKPVKEEFQAVQQQYEQKKRVYEATSINITSQMEPLKNQVKELTDRLNSKEDEWKNLRQRITKAESLQEVVTFEMKNSMQSPRKPSKMEALKRKVDDMEQIVKRLEEEQQAISSRQGAVEEQTKLWENTLQLLRCKMRARSEPAARQGRMHITQHSQMLTLN